MKKIARVVFDLPIKGCFDYLIPRLMLDRIEIGSRVKVPFRNLNKIAYVVGLSDISKIRKIRPVISVIDKEPIIDARTLSLLKELACYYNCSWGEMIATALPVAIRNGKCLTRYGEQKNSKKSNSKFRVTLVCDETSQKRWDFLYRQIKKALSLNQGVIFLEPQIVYIDAIVRWIRTSFDSTVAVLHSRQSQNKEFVQWVDIKSGKVNIVVGTRSAIFAPLSNLGMIIINREDDPAYKQEQSPFYHARRIALFRARQSKAHLVLISQLPSLESYYSALTKEYKFVNLAGKLRNPPKIEVVDMNQDSIRIKKNKVILSTQLENDIHRVLTMSKKTILFINRLGFATSLRCKKCGYSLKCARCSVSLTYHYDRKKLICRFCNYQTRPIDICPQCKSSYIRYSGVGAEKLESEMHRLFPQAKIMRWDSEVGIKNDNFDILISTQILLEKGIDCNLLGVLYLDTSLNRVDFRSSERTFSLLFRLSKLAKDKMVIQTHNPQHDCIQAIIRNDPFLFYRNELKHRKEAGFPPFKHFVQIQLRGRSEQKTKDVVFTLYAKLKYHKPRGINILEPFSGSPSRLRGNYRWNILLKGNSPNTINSYINTRLKDLKNKSGIMINTNVDI
jgi:primosomal protein N' (replication factor Y)